MHAADYSSMLEDIKNDYNIQSNSNSKILQDHSYLHEIFTNLLVNRIK